ncbi:hypothetical protein FT641_18030 [Bacillus paranthracis]|uniref:hypothetical protein n=1 Tax=Bacillus paranthracis TaxID=2026186 RepID=UPI001879DF54|nr:hypothetical protein [Bacillus paranthracis]MBE7114539.1 hypothetical protein [Bacillus paranthracis]MBE7154587.1 hypothetical protein [Bacillus paranthracis]
MKKGLHEVDEAVNYEGFVIRLNSEGDSEYVQREKKSVVFSCCAKRDVLEFSKPAQEVNFHPYRKLVDVDEDKLERDYNKFLEFFRTYSQSLLTGVWQKLKRGYEGKTLSVFGVVDEEVYNLTFRNAVDVIFNANNGVLDFEDAVYGTFGVTHDVFLKYLDVKKVSKAVTQCRLMINGVKSNKYLPVNDYTKNYIKLEKGLTLITLNLDKTSGFRRGITEEFMTVFLTDVYENGFEVVDSYQNMYYMTLNILVKNNEVSKFLSCLKDNYEVWSLPAYNNDYSLSVDIEKNVGHGDATTDYFYILNGKHYESLKEHFVLEENKYLGLDSYK